MATGPRPGLTSQQYRAVTARTVSVALSAGAGCGKTFVLTERFLSHLDPAGTTGEDRLELKELVAITFTERAAREMRERIRRECRERLLECSDREAAHWLGLMRQLDSARISTIHAFCGNLIRTHALEAGIDPQFQVLEQAQAEMLQYEAIDDELRDRLTSQDEATIELVVEFGLDRLRRMVATLLGRRQDVAWQEWQSVTPDALVARWQVHWREVTLPKLLAKIVQSPCAQSVLELVNGHSPRHAAMELRCRVLRECLGRLGDSPDPLGDLEAIRENARVQSGGGKSAWPSEAVYEQFRDAAAGLRKVVEDALSCVRFDMEEARAAASHGLQLLEIASGVDRRYESQKRQLGGLDFDDLLIRTRGLLADPSREAVRRRIASGIRVLLVDEFQDTDPLQLELVKLLAGDDLMRGKLFFVGDYKQSIYRFRGADPQVFRQLREATPAEGRLPLTLNFRSQPAILDFVNGLFCDDLGPEYEPLRASRPQVGPTPAVEFLWAPDEPSGERNGQKERLRRREADWIARRLRAMLDEGEKIVWDEEAARQGKPAVREVRQGDIALLFRALSDIQYYEEALRRYGIDYYLVGGHAFYAQQEVFDLLNLLRAIASPSDEVSLAGVLRSPFFSIEDETLFWLAQHPGGLRCGLFAEELPAELSEPQSRRVQFAATTLTGLRRWKDRLPIAAVIQEALERTGYDAVVLAEFLGERKLANLRKLLEQARSFDRTGAFTLWDFITQLSEFVARQPDEPLAATNPESTDVVRLMTIHQSKGLEFPVVVVPDVDRRMLGPANPVAFTRELGPMIKTPASGGYQLYALETKEEELAEMIRLLYVATTRAADRLILSAGVPELGAAGGPWTELINRRFDPLTGAFVTRDSAGGNRPPAESRVTCPAPQVRVVTSEPPLNAKAVPRTRAVRLDRLVENVERLAARRGRVPKWLGPVAVEAGARRQYSFSRLTGAIVAGAPRLEEEFTADGPVSGTEDVDSARMGSLVHAVLAKVDFAHPGNVAGLVDRCAGWHLPGGSGRLDEATAIVRKFLRTPRAAELAAAGALYREVDFLLAWPPDTREPQPRYLQGIIDCLYQDAGGRWHLLEYKTGRTQESATGWAAEYEMQVLVYALAVEQIFGRPPDELVLCFVRSGVERTIVWKEDTRERVIAMVDQSIAELQE